MATVRERQAVKLLQERIETLRDKVQGAAAGWKFTRRKTVLAWVMELDDTVNQFNYTINHLLTEEVNRVRVAGHPCHDQYCYDMDPHACHQDGCSH